MKIKALVSFVGAVTLAYGEVAEVGDKLAASLISAGYAEEVQTSDEIKRSVPKQRKTGVKD